MTGHTRLARTRVTFAGYASRMKGPISCLVLVLFWLAAPAAAQSPSYFETQVRSRGTPDIPGLNMVWLIPWGSLEHARDWRHIVVHQSEGAVGSAFRIGTELGLWLPGGDTVGDGFAALSGDLSGLYPTLVS